MDFIKNINDSIEYANSGQTKLNDKAISMQGMSSPKIRNFLNKMVSYPGVSYLEIGVWRGSTFYSALYGNNPEYALAIDNFSMFDGDEPTFKKNMSDVNTDFSFINSHSFDIKNKPQKKFNIYFYDGDHSVEGQKLALTYYQDMLMDEYVYICDDWNWDKVKRGTMEGIQENKLKIIQEWILPANFNGDMVNWWNGLWVAVLKKTT